MPSLHEHDVKLPKFARFVEVNNDALLLLFLNLNTVLYHIAQKNSLTFDKLNDIKKSDEY